QIITLPYNILLQKSARDAMGLKLQDQVVIIDEAHNLVETISSTYASSLSLSQLCMVQTSLRGYLSRYQRRLSPKNATNVRLLLVLLDSMVESLESWRKKREHQTKESEVVNTNGFLNRCGVESINLMHLCTFLHESKLARKLHSFAEKVRTASDLSGTSENQRDEHRTTSDVHAFQGFLFSLADSDADGRVILVEKEDDVGMQYILLNPAERFRSIVHEARSVILAGGTMGSVELLRHHLFPYVSPEKILHFSCGHVVPDDAVLTLSLSTGPSGKELRFTHEHKQDTSMMDDLGAAIVNFCNLVPAGIVCFFPSYSYLEAVCRQWKEGNTRLRLGARKEVFFETRGGDTTRILADYTQAIKGPKEGKSGAILFSVVGGRLSEGINFSDDLARAVIQVGLPFPDLHSVELREKLRYLDLSSEEKTGGAKKAIKDQSSHYRMGPQATAYYENLCMRSVNQSIGMAIRHREDYACILLLDARFSVPRISQRLPSWLSQRAQQADRFGQAVGKVAQFFRLRRSLQENTR
ncbi:helicase C-terminal domain-containing protein, partial [Piptocephalis cylindrospora]